MIVITGASGKTGSRTADLLLQSKRQVRVLGRTADHLKQFGDRGADVLVGDQSDPDFLTKAFMGAEAAYLIIPPKYDYPQDYRAYYNTISDAAITAIKASGLRKVVFLSSLGAERDTGTGPILGLHDVEAKLNALRRVDVAVIRAGFMMENLLVNLDTIRNRRILGDSVEPDVPILMVASRDIGDKAAEILLDRKFRGHEIIELFGDRFSYRDAVKVVGRSLDIPDLPYVRFADDDAINAMTGMGVSRTVAESFIEMSRGLNTGKLATRKLKPDSPNGSTRFGQFVDEVLKPAYNSQGLKRAA